VQFCLNINKTNINLVLVKLYKNKKMKKIFTSLFVAFTATISFAQVPDFTVTDTEGNTHNLYSYLNTGYVVILDVSATWCGPCWSFHEEHFLNEINAEFGSAGSDKVKVLFYEGDATTGEDDMNGTGSNTSGNWTTGVTYPLINESPVQLDLGIYAPLGFPTINVICPSDKTIKADLFDSWGGSDHAADYAAMKTVIENTITECTSGNGGSSAGITESTNENQNASIYPNPSTGIFTFTYTSNTNSEIKIEIVDIVGKIVYSNTLTISNGVNEIDINIPNVVAGQYILTASDDINKSVVKQIQVK
jgi:thiol-disulfide isomerase/thioredoxin